MAKFRVWAQNISDVYLDVEAENEDEAYERAKDMDGGDFHSTPYGDWKMGSIDPLPDDAEVDFDNEYFEEIEE